MLARREHSRQELARKLDATDTDPDELARVLDELERRGWLSEKRLAEQHVARAKGRFGALRVLADLRGKGVDKDTLNAAAAELKRTELEDARALWRKRFGVPASDLRARARQVRFLRGRGFSAEVVHAVVGGEDDQ